MKTDDLIKALAADTATAEPPISQTLRVWLVAGVAASTVILFFYLGGVRPDLALAAAQSWHVAAKFAFTVLLAIAGYLLIQRAARPDGNVAELWPLAIAAPALLLGAAGYEFATRTDAGSVTDVIMVPNWTMCVRYIPLLSLAPLAATLFALKQGAPANPAAAGAIGGLLSGALGATLYATYCDADSPLFVVVWYPLGIALMTAIGGLIGSKLLKW